MFKFIRTLFFIICFLLGFIYLFLLFVDLNHFKTPIENEISLALNRKVSVEDLTLKMSLSPTLQVKNISVYNTADFNEKSIFGKVEMVDVGFKVLPLFKGIFQVQSVSLKGLQINLIEKQGQVNWSFSDKTKDENSASEGVVEPEQVYTSSPKFNFNRIKVEHVGVKDGLISYSKNGQVRVLKITNISLSEMKNLFAQIVYDDVPIEVNFSDEDLLDNLQNDSLKDFTFNIRAYGSLAKISGTVGILSSLSNLNLRVDISTPDLNKTLSMVQSKELSDLFVKENASVVFAVQGALNNFRISEFKATVENTGSLQLDVVSKDLFTEPNISFDGGFEFRSAALIEKYDIQPIGATFKGRFKDKRATFDKMTLFVNKSDIQTEGFLDLNNDIPELKAKIYSSYFDVADVLVEKNSLKAAVHKNEQNVKQSVDQKIDFSVLKKLNADLQVSFSNLKLTYIDKEYHQGSLKILLKDGVLSVNPLQFNLFGGQVLGVFDVDAHQELPKVSATVQAKNVDLSLVKELSEYLKNTPASVNIKLQAQGDTKQALLSSLDGQIEGEILSGQFINKWMNSLPSLIGLAAKSSAFSYAGSNNQSKIDCMAVKLKVHDGIIHSDENIALETSALNLVVSGDINLVQQDLSLSVLPSLNQLSSKTNKNISYLQYFRVQGPFSQIKIQENVKGAIENLVQEKAQKAIQKLTGETVIEPQEQQIGDLCQIAQGKKAKIEPKKQKVQEQIKEAVETKVKDVIQNKISETALKLLNKQ